MRVAVSRPCPPARVRNLAFSPMVVPYTESTESTSGEQPSSSHRRSRVPLQRSLNDQAVLNGPPRTHLSFRGRCRLTAAAVPANENARPAAPAWRRANAHNEPRGRSSVRHRDRNTLPTEQYAPTRIPPGPKGATRVVLRLRRHCDVVRSVHEHELSETPGEDCPILLPQYHCVGEKSRGVLCPSMAESEEPGESLCVPTPRGPPAVPAQGALLHRAASKSQMTALEPGSIDFSVS